MYYNLTTEQALIKSKYILKNVSNSNSLNYKEYQVFKPNYSVINKEFDEFSLEFWNQFNITKSILEKYEVECVSHVLKNNNIYLTSKEKAPIFSYKENKELFKIYNPFGFIEYKFRIVKSILEGYSKVENSDLLFITSSYKDTMVLNSIGFQAFNLSAETNYRMLEKIKEELFQRFNKIYIYLDNDNAGKTYSKKLTLEIDKRFRYINNPDSLPKDPSDLVKKFGTDILLNIINEKLIRDEQK